jgi:phosphofructokinase-like protein
VDPPQVAGAEGVAQQHPQHVLPVALPAVLGEHGQPDLAGAREVVDAEQCGPAREHAVDVDGELRGAARARRGAAGLQLLERLGRQGRLGRLCPCQRVEAGPPQRLDVAGAERPQDHPVSGQHGRTLLPRPALLLPVAGLAALLFPRTDEVEAQVRIGVLTGGGDCPGLNAVIRAVVRKGVEVYGHEFVGFRDGWRGPLEGHTMELGVAQTRGVLPRGGTILGSSRTNVMKVENGVERVRENLEKAGVDALVAIGGEDTLGVATQLAAAGLTVVGVPKTIDNDLSATDYTFGFDTAVQIAVDAIDRLHTTAESHHRALIVEVMGRHAGWIALHSGLAGGANVILIPERPFDIEQVCKYVEARFARQFAPILVVAEGAQPKEGTLALQTGDLDAFGHVRLGGIGAVLEREIQARTGYESRQTVLGHVQRGGTPTAYDRVLATRFGLAAADAVHEGVSGVMVALQGTDIVRVPLEDATRELKTVPVERYAEAEVFFG